MRQRRSEAMTEMTTETWLRFAAQSNEEFEETTLGRKVLSLCEVTGLTPQRILAVIAEVKLKRGFHIES